ncbi:DUF4199 domain-containing protein [Formosa sp. S-31]|uniref:DUF4199 domain-containing protein n=1 Tax=Formosa sp. S-31 TaxID=2790949 RepID=UPI003EBF45F1
MENSSKSIAVTYGIYLALLLSSVTILAYVINLEWLTSMGVGIGLFIVILIFGIISIVKTKKLSQGFISFKEAFTAYFKTVVIGVLISSVVSIILFNYIDPDAADFLQEQVIIKTTKMMENFGTPQEAIDKAIADIRNQNQFDLLNQAKSLAMQLVFYAVIGLIIAFILKKNDPEAN